MTADCAEFKFLSPPRGTDELGRLGSYRVLKLLGQGGMGMVFLAEDVHLQRTVALKVMLPELAKRPAAKERFLREARAIAKIEHDHIVTVYQVGEDQGVPFLAMQLLKGMSLEDFLSRREGTKTGAVLRLDQILRLGREIAKGLEAAHARGLIHRDVKPANVWLDASAGGRVKILDFGLARPADGDAQLTQNGMIVGTPAYMAPEQARGRAIDARVDLFSLGCVLYRLCTGKLPWAGDDVVGTLLAVATEKPVPVQDLKPDLPPPLADLVLKLLAKKPEDRPASAAAVVEALKAIERDQPTIQMAGSPQTTPRDPGVTTPTPALTRSGRKWPTGIVLALVLGGMVAIAALAVAAATFYVRTDVGTLQMETTHEEAQVIVEQNGKQVDLLSKNNNMKVRLHSGEYQLRLADTNKNLKLDSDRIQIARNGVAVVTISDVKQEPVVDRPQDSRDRPDRPRWPRKKR